MKRIKAVYFLIIVLLLIVFSCDKKKSLATILVVEENGLDRNLEYIHVNIPLPRGLKTTENLVAVDSRYVSTPVQVIDTIQKGEYSFMNIVFPVAIKANETKKFKIQLHVKPKEIAMSQLHFSRLSQYVENEYYKVNFATKNDKRGGQVLNLNLKKFDNKILKRHQNTPIHWAPNFANVDSQRYFTLENLTPSSINIVRDSGPYEITKIRSGVTDSVPEIHVEGKYTFYEGLPYFEFNSIMTVKEDVNLRLLRNDEMTMDSLFTNLIFIRPDNSISNLKLYDTELDILEKDHMSDQAQWLAFYHKEKEYGYGSIRLEYDNTNVNGELSPLYKPYTKISKSVGNGRYWNRILVADTNFRIPKGSRYREKNAYLIFKVDSEEPEKEIKYHSERLNNPLKITVEKN